MHGVVWSAFIWSTSDAMNRRDFLAVLGGTLVLGGAFGTRTQAATAVRHIGFLAPGVQLDPAEFQRIWAPARELGWIEGQNLIVERRYAGGKSELLQLYAEELVRLKVEIIVTAGTLATTAAKNATTRIPIIMSGGDPVRAGLVASLAKPGGNITGLSNVAPELDAKRLGLLRELLPKVQRVGVLLNPANRYSEIAGEERERVYRSLGMQAIIVGVAEASEVENAVAEAARRRAQALIVSADNVFYDNRTLLMQAALRHSLPTIVSEREYLAAGGLLLLGIDVAERYRSFAYLMDKILRGAKPADLPIQQPTKFELVINLKTAKALGITIPQSLLLRADEVIQ
jgi:putative ABC transport system substrate-binding protein